MTTAPSPPPPTKSALGPPTGTSKSSYGYDDVGNTTTRLLHGDQQSLHWDVEGHLTKVTQPAGDSGTQTTSYIYDADGNRLITRTGDRTTLTLGDHTELTLDKGTDEPKATRDIPLGSGNQAVLSDNGGRRRRPPGCRHRGVVSGSAGRWRAEKTWKNSADGSRPRSRVVCLIRSGTTRLPRHPY
ncbi:hypothetical protein OHT02_37950 [Streptomyces platensis]